MPTATKTPHQIAHTYDAVFERHRGFIPLSFLRALAYSESGLRADSDMLKEHPEAKSGAIGLFQTMGEVLNDWNLRHPSETYTRDQLTDPEVATRVGVNLVERIAKSYTNNHPKTLTMDWTDPRWVALLAAGFNAGYSEGGGLGHIVGLMEKEGISKDRVTVDTVQQMAAHLRDAAKDPKRYSGRFLADPKRLAYWKTVANRYQIDRGAGADVLPSSVTPASKRPPSDAASSLWVTFGLAIAVPIGLYVAASRMSTHRGRGRR
jgi:hypothetical protein